MKNRDPLSEMERQLPEWMTKTAVKQTSNDVPKAPSAPAVTGSVFDRKLAYCMSPRELQMIAKEILGVKKWTTSRL